MVKWLFLEPLSESKLFLWGNVARGLRITRRRLPNAPYETWAEGGGVVQRQRRPGAVLAGDVRPTRCLWTPGLAANHARSPGLWGIELVGGICAARIAGCAPLAKALLLFRYVAAGRCQGLPPSPSPAPERTVASVGLFSLTHRILLVNAILDHPCSFATVSHRSRPLNADR